MRRRVAAAMLGETSINLARDLLQSSKWTNTRLSMLESSPWTRVNKETRLPVGAEMHQPEHDDGDGDDWRCSQTASH